MPQRRKKCPFCKKSIFIRTSLSARQKILVTENEAEKIDQEWQKIGFKEGWLSRLKQYGITEKDFDTRKNELSKKSGFERTDQDTIWSLYNDKIHGAIKSGSLHLLKELNWEMALFLKEEGKDFLGCLQESQKMRLLEYKQQGIKKVRIISPGGCKACIKMMGKVLTIDKALEEMPLPVRDCTYWKEEGQSGWCRCRYLAYFDDPKLEQRRRSFTSSEAPVR